jgi:Toxin PAAR-like domain
MGKEISQGGPLMPQTTFVNGRGIAHQTSRGSSTVFPDVCNTPVGSSIVPIPYSNTGYSLDTAKGPSTVKTDGSMPMVRDAEYSKTTGDEPGTNGGVVSGTNTDICQFATYSFDVKFEGRNVCRLGDQLFHNNNNTMG